MSEKNQMGSIETLIDAAEVAATFAKKELLAPHMERTVSVAEAIHALEAATKAMLAAYEITKSAPNAAASIIDRMYGR